MYLLTYNIDSALPGILIGQPNITTKLEDAKVFFVTENDNSLVVEDELEINEEDKPWHRYRWENLQSELHQKPIYLIEILNLRKSCFFM